MDNLFTLPEKFDELSEVLSVTALSKKINSALEARIGKVEVIGQVNSPKLTHHWYFTLADDDSKIDCAMWATKLGGVSPKEWKPKQGDLVHVTGTVGHYAKFGKTQLYVDKIRQAGDEKGKLHQQFEALVKELREKGWFDEEHKQPLPEYPRKIAVITSKTSAAVKDVIETAKQRYPAVELLIVNVPVQGDAAVPAIISAIQNVDRVAHLLGIDAIIVTRGGGALEELWSFNDRGVAEAAFQCKTPIVAAIGHESDVSIIELVADHRASTPTQAVMVLIPDKDELFQMVDHQSKQLHNVASIQIERWVAGLSQLTSQLLMKANNFMQRLKTVLADVSETLMERKPHTLFGRRQKLLLECDASLQRVAKTRLQSMARQLASYASTMEAVDPMSVLQRGFTLTQDKEGRLVRSPENVKQGDQILTVLSDGTIDSIVECAS